MQEDPFNTLPALWESVSQYLDTKIQLIKLQAIDKAAHTSTFIVSQLILLVTALFFLLFLNIAIALWIGALSGKLYDGFFIVAAFYMLLSLFLFLFKKKLIKKPIQHFLIKKLLK